MSSAAILSRVEEMKEAYAILRRLADPKYFGTNRFDDYWRKLAELTATNGVDGRRYVQWAYEFICRNAPLPYVQQITSPKIFKLYFEQGLDEAKQLRLLVDLQRNTLKTQKQLGRSDAEIVANSRLELGVVFRYAIAYCAGLHDWVEKLRVDAETEMYFQPGYRELLADFLPAEEMTNVRLGRTNRGKHT